MSENIIKELNEREENILTCKADNSEPVDMEVYEICKKITERMAKAFDELNGNI